MNKVELIGRPTTDPSFKYSTDGVAVSNFTLAVRRPYIALSNENQTDFIKIVAFRNIAENIKKYVVKGKLICIVGKLQTKTYKKDNDKRYVTEVVVEEIDFLDKKGLSLIREDEF